MSVHEPCPVCKGVGYVFRQATDGGWRVVCSDCDAEGPGWPGSTQDNAAATWNIWAAAQSQALPWMAP